MIKIFKRFAHWKQSGGEILKSFGCWIDQMLHAGFLYEDIFFLALSAIVYELHQSGRTGEIDIDYICDMIEGQVNGIAENGLKRLGGRVIH